MILNDLIITDGKQKISVTNDTTVYVGVFPIFEPLGWLS